MVAAELGRRLWPPRIGKKKELETPGPVSPRAPNWVSQLDRDTWEVGRRVPEQVAVDEMARYRVLEIAAKEGIVDPNSSLVGWAEKFALGLLEQKGVLYKKGTVYGSIADKLEPERKRYRLLLATDLERKLVGLRKGLWPWTSNFVKVGTFLLALATFVLVCDRSI